MKKDFSLLLWAIIIAFCAFVSSCGDSTPQMTIKCHVVGSGIKYVVQLDRGYDQGDTTISNFQGIPKKIVIDTILIR